MQIIVFPSLLYPLSALDNSRNLDDPSNWARNPGTNMVDRRRRPCPPPGLWRCDWEQNASSCLVPYVDYVGNVIPRLSGPVTVHKQFFKARMPSYTEEPSVTRDVLGEKESQKVRCCTSSGSNSLPGNIRTWTPK